MSTWRYTQNGQKCGPIGEAELKALLSSGVLPHDTLVSKEGTDYWAPANSFAELGGTAAGVGATPPPPGNNVPPLSSPPPIQQTMPMSDAEDIERNKVFAVLAYIGILFLVPLLAAPQSRFARFHTNQGIVLFLAGLILCAASAILAMIPFVGCLVAFAPAVIGIGWLVLMIIGIVNAASGHYKPLPLIGHYRILD
jgi:uncharacterized membrane protein